MAEIKRFIKNTNIKTRAISILLVVTILAGSFIWFGNNNIDNVSAEGSEKTYMEYIIDRIVGGLQEEFKVLEIVPYIGQGEFRYYAGADEVENGLESRQDMLEDMYRELGNSIIWNTGEWTNKDTWQKLIKYYSNFGYELRYNSADDIFEVRSPELFINNVLPDYADILNDRIHVDTVEANDLTAEVIESADLIVISTGTHDNNTLNAYSAWSGIYEDPFYTSAGAVTSDSDYDTYEKVVAEDGTVSYVSRDASWEMCETLLDYIINGRDLQLTDGTVIENIKTPVVLDNKEAGYLDKDGNMYKLGLMYRMLASDRYEAIKPYISTTYTAADGTVKSYINSKNIVTAALDTTATGTFDETTKTSWGGSSDENNNPIIKFFNTKGGLYSDYYDPNPVSPVYLTDDYWIYSGDSVLIPVNSATEMNMTWSTGFAERTGNTTSTNGILQYLLGAKPSQIKTFDFTLKVLEVEPCNSFDYDTFEEVKALGKRLYMAGTDSWTEENYRNYLDVDCVTTNALNGMTDDLIATYDMIIIGENIELLTKDSDGKTIYNDRNLNGYIYLAYGDLFKIATNYLGILPEDYQELVNSDQTGWFTKISESTSYLYTDYVYSSLVANGGTGKVFISKNMYEYYRIDGSGKYGKNSYDSSTGELYLDYSLGNVRGADNDITDITKAKLVQYAQAGKPVVLSDSLYYLDDSTIYPTSDIYNYAESLAVKNEKGRRIYGVVRQQYIGGAIVYLDTDVPEITMLEQPAEPVYTDGVISTFGSRQMTYRFNLKGQYGKTYRIKLYVDKNSDGVFKGIEEGISDDRNELYFSETVTLTGGNATEYTINSRLSDNFVGILSWKIEVVQLDDAGNETALANSVKGYSAIKNEEAEQIRVLQILPMQNVHLDMSYDNPSSSTDFQDLLRKIEDTVGYSITIDTMTISEFVALYETNAAGDNSYTKGTDLETEKDKLRSYDMVVIGFSDMYGWTDASSLADITNANGALDNILDFIDIGKAVLFTHDTLSWRVTPNHVTSTVDGSSRVEMWDTHTLNAWGAGYGGRFENFAYELTLALRNKVGLDKYGITLKEEDRDGKEVPVYSSALTAPNYATQAADGKYYVNELQGFSTWNVYRGNFLEHFVTEYDYTRRGLNCIVPYTNTEWIYGSSKAFSTTQVAQLNEGAVTMYPYAIDEKLTVAKTHAQYYELDMEDEDIVVWYTLSDDGTDVGGFYECTEKDAGNNYYIYSKDNITYSGAGHSAMTSEMELRLFVNTIVKAIAGGNNEPELMVTNGAVGDGGIYMIYVDSTYTADEYEMDIKATDADLISPESANGNLDLVGKFKEANVYWVKSDGTEVKIKSYTDSNPLRNGIVSELKLSDTSLSVTELAYIEEIVEKGGYAEFRIEVYDWIGAKDEITVRLVERELFNLE